MECHVAYKARGLRIKMLSAVVIEKTRYQTRQFVVIQEKLLAHIQCEIGRLCNSALCGILNNLFDFSVISERVKPPPCTTRSTATRLQSRSSMMDWITLSADL